MNLVDRRGQSPRHTVRVTCGGALTDSVIDGRSTIHGAQ